MDRKMAKNYIFSIMKTLSGILYPLITVPYISRTLSVEGVGAINFATALVDIFIVIASLGIPTYAMREGGKWREDVRAFSNFASEMLLIMLVSSSVCFAGYCFLILRISAFNKNFLIFILIGISILLNFLDVSYIFSVYEDFRYITLRTIFFQIVSLFLLLVFVKSESDVLWYAFTLLIARSGNSFANFKYSKKYVLWKFEKRSIIKEHLKPIFYFFAISAASNIYLSADKVMLGVLCDENSVGIYSASTKIVQILRNVIATISVVCLPRAMLYYKEDKKRYHQLISDVLNIILLLTIPMAVGCGCIASNIINLIYGVSYEPAIFSFRILVFNSIVALVNGVLAYQILAPQGKEKVVFAATLLGCIFNILLNLFFLPQFGENAAALTTMFSEIVTFSVLIIFIKIDIPIKQLLRDITGYIVASAAFFLLYVFIKEYINKSVLMLFIYILLSVVIYIFTLVIFKNSIVFMLFKKLKERNS